MCNRPQIGDENFAANVINFPMEESDGFGLYPVWKFCCSYAIFAFGYLPLSIYFFLADSHENFFKTPFLRQFFFTEKFCETLSKNLLRKYLQKVELRLQTDAGLADRSYYIISKKQTIVTVFLVAVELFNNLLIK